MEIVPIFAGVDLETEGGLFAFRHPGEADDEFVKLLGLWQDDEYLYRFLSENEKYLANPFWKGLTVDEAAVKIRKELKWLLDYLCDIEDSGPERPFLEELFKPLHNRDGRLFELQGHKTDITPHKLKPPLLRIYAIRLHGNLYLITGGAIKLCHFMDEHEDTKKEVEKFEKALRFLRKNDIGCADDLNSIL